MQHILDNPMWNAAITGNKSIVSGTDKAIYFRRDMSIFSGVPEYDSAHFEELARLTPPGMVAAFFTAGRIVIPGLAQEDGPGDEEIESDTKEIAAGVWKMVLEKPILQMIFAEPKLEVEDISDIVVLRDEHIPAMTELAELTKPGPWLPRTIDFGHFEGIFAGGQLAAMCGQRLQPTPYSEISGVCVHPDHQGKGYAKKLIRNQLRHIVQAHRIPMLHLYSDNVSACRLYESMGFETRCEMMVYMIKRIG